MWPISLNIVKYRSEAQTSENEKNDSESHR